MQAKSPSIREVGIVFKTHLDIGFTDLAKNILRRYMDDYIPGALDLARRTRKSPRRFVWTTGSWLAYRYLEDAPAKERRKMEQAIEAGDFHWHALPFTTHTELMNPDLFRLGLHYSAILDKRFNRTTRSAKLTDVPGHTIGIVPLLAKAGVRLLHIGVNPASTVPAVPPVFRWRCGEDEIIVIYESDYGDVTPLPGGRALCINLTGDNLGPQNSGQIDKVYERLEQSFPSAKLLPGGMDCVAENLWKQRAELPVVTAEIGDTWIHGVGTDPLKTAQLRNLSALRSHWLKSGALAEGSATDLAFGEQLLLTAEHTWGMDLKTHLKDWKNYAPAAFAKVRTQPNFKLVEKSWQEQRGYIKAALKALPDPLRKEADAQLRELKPRIREQQKGWQRLPTSQTEVHLGGFAMQLDPASGAIASLKNIAERRTLSVNRSPFASLAFQTYSKADYERFYKQYNLGEADWSRKDFTKPGLPASVKAAIFQTTFLKAEQHSGSGDVRLFLRFTAAAKRLGAPAVAVLEISQTDAARLNLRLELHGQSASRLPQALWFNLHPRLQQQAHWQLLKLGQWIDPRNVVKGGNRRLHAIDGQARAGDVNIHSQDAPLVCPETGTLLDFAQKLPRTNRGLAFNLYNNKWGTNFPMWYEGDSVFRFSTTWNAR